VEVFAEMDIEETEVIDSAPAEEEEGIEAMETEGGAEVAEASGILLRRIVVARDVEGREPVGASETFEQGGGALYAFVEAASESDLDQDIVITFERPDGTAVGFVNLLVPAEVPRWRTWARTHNVGQTGQWAAVARTAEGELLGRRPFTVTE